MGYRQNKLWDMFDSMQRFHREEPTWIFLSADHPRGRTIGFTAFPEKQDPQRHKSVQWNICISDLFNSLWDRTLQGKPFEKVIGGTGAPRGLQTSKGRTELAARLTAGEILVQVP